MKFMDQSLFEVCALTLAAFKTKSAEAHSALKASLYESYHPAFTGDNLWFGQLDSTVDEAHDVAKKIAAGKETKLLLLAAEVRKQLDDDLAPKSGLMQKFGLDGTHFTKSHLAPLIQTRDRQN